MILRRFSYKGKEERLPEIEAAINKMKITRRDMYLILKYFELNQDVIESLEQQYPDV